MLAFQSPNHPPLWLISLPYSLSLPLCLTRLSNQPFLTCVPGGDDSDGNFNHRHDELHRSWPKDPHFLGRWSSSQRSELPLLNDTRPSAHLTAVFRLPRRSVVRQVWSSDRAPKRAFTMDTRITSPSSSPLWVSTWKRHDSSKMTLSQMALWIVSLSFSTWPTTLRECNAEIQGHSVPDFDISDHLASSVSSRRVWP